MGIKLKRKTVKEPNPWIKCKYCGSYIINLHSICPECGSKLKLRE